LAGARSGESKVVEWDDVALQTGELVIACTDGGTNPALRGVCVMLSAKSLSIRLFHNLRKALREDLSDDPRANGAFEAMAAELRDPAFGTRTLVEALMMQCYVLALRRQIDREECVAPSMIGSRDPIIGDALLRMADNPEQDHTVDSFARGCGMSRSAFAKRFARALGQSPMSMLKEIRMSHAAGLLKTTNMSIDMVASSVGYASRSYFSRAFKTSFEMDPKTFRDRSQARSRPTRSLPRGSSRRSVRSFNGFVTCASAGAAGDQRSPKSAVLGAGKLPK
jgi:AraC-like DNA-binding protein